MRGLILENVVKSYGGFTLNIDLLEVHEGIVACIRGPNGSGKSTLLNIISGIVFPDSGRITYNDIDITYLEPEKRRFPLVRSEKGVFPHMSVEKNIKIAKRVDQSELEKIVDLLQIGSDMMKKKARDLSTGWKIRVAIARALASRPNALLIDEGLDHLDPGYAKCCLKDLIDYVREKRIITLIVTHKSDIGCDEEVVMLNGSIAGAREEM